MTRQMEMMKRQAKELERELTGHSLVDSLRATSEETARLGEELKELPERREISVMERISTQRVLREGETIEGRALAREVTNIPRALPVEIAPNLERLSQGATNVNITIQGPWYIREEADIERIAKAISREQMRAIRNRTGGRL